MTFVPLLTNSLSKSFFPTSLFLVFFSSIRTKVAGIKAYIAMAEQIKKQDALINELKNRLALKDRIISIMAHDIRSPLDSLKGLLELLSEKKLNEKEFLEITSNINLQVDQLSHFLENLLKWIKNITTEIKPHFEEILLHKVVNESVGLYVLQAEKKKIKIQSMVSTSTTIYADKEMTKLILRNLINNAIKFCGAGDRIKISAQERPGEVCISVNDTGPGISKENISKLFDPVHLSTTGTKNEIGTGLGLALCKAFIEKMGGKICVTSKEGVGTKFSFTIHSPTPASYEFLQFAESAIDGDTNTGGLHR